MITVDFSSKFTTAYTSFTHSTEYLGLLLKINNPVMRRLFKDKLERSKTELARIEAMIVPKGLIYCIRQHKRFKVCWKVENHYIEYI